MLPNRFQRPVSVSLLTMPRLIIGGAVLIVLAVLGFGAATMGTPPVQATVTTTLPLNL